MENVLAGLTNKSCMVYIDDVLGHWQDFPGASWELARSFSTVEVSRFEVEAEQLGFVVSREGLHQILKKLKLSGLFPNRMM